MGKVERPNPDPLYVYTSDGRRRGEVRGGRNCQMEGCLGTRLCTLWPDGHMTWPCTRGMKVRKDGHWQII